MDVQLSSSREPNDNKRAVTHSGGAQMGLSTLSMFVFASLQLRLSCRDRLHLGVTGYLKDWLSPCSKKEFFI